MEWWEKFRKGVKASGGRLIEGRRAMKGEESGEKEIDIELKAVQR